MSRPQPRSPRSPQPTSRSAAKPLGRPRKVPGAGRSPAIAGGAGRVATRGGGEVIELECGITVYPARSEGGRWRAAWYALPRGRGPVGVRLG
jgi:hypothetical protein